MTPCRECAYEDGKHAYFCPLGARGFFVSTVGTNANPPKPARPQLASVVADQVGELVAGLDDFESREEMPRPPADLTTYADAFASAARNCPHENTTNILYNREWQCDDCHRYLDKAAMRKAKPFGWMFG